MAEVGDLLPVDDNNTARWPEGQAPSTVNDAGRADEGIISRWHRDTNGSLTSTGTGTAYQLTTNQNLTAYYDGLEITFTAHVDCGNSPTLQLDALGAANIVTPDQSQLVSGDIVNGSKINVIYDGSAWQIMNISAAGNIAYLNAANVFTADQTISKSDDGAAAGPSLKMLRTSASPAASDLLAEIPFAGNNSSAAEVTYAQVTTQIQDPTAASEDGRLLLQTTTGGVLGTALSIEKGVFSPNATGGDPGVDIVNVKDLQFDNVSIKQQLAKAWVNFSASGGTITERDSFNASVSRISQGEYSVTFATAFANANYVAVGNVVQNLASGGRWFLHLPHSVAPTTTTYRFQVVDFNGSTQDPEFVNIVFFGDQ